MSEGIGSMDRLKELISYVEGMSAEQMQMHIIRTQVERSVRDLQLRDDEARIKAEAAKKEAEAHAERQAQAFHTPYLWFVLFEFYAYSSDAAAWLLQQLGVPCGIITLGEWLRQGDVAPEYKDKLLQALDQWMTRKFIKRNEMKGTEQS